MDVPVSNPIPLFTTCRAIVTNEVVQSAEFIHTTMLMDINKNIIFGLELLQSFLEFWSDFNLEKNIFRSTSQSKWREKRYQLKFKVCEGEVQRITFFLSNVPTLVTKNLLDEIYTLFIHKISIHFYPHYCLDNPMLSPSWDRHMKWENHDMKISYLTKWLIFFSILGQLSKVHKALRSKFVQYYTKFVEFVPMQAVTKFPNLCKITEKIKVAVLMYLEPYFVENTTNVTLNEDSVPRDYASFSSLFSMNLTKLTLGKNCDKSTLLDLCGLQCRSMDDIRCNKAIYYKPSTVMSSLKIMEIQCLGLSNEICWIILAIFRNLEECYHTYCQCLCYGIPFYFEIFDDTTSEETSALQTEETSKLMKFPKYLKIKTLNINLMYLNVQILNKYWTNVNNVSIKFDSDAETSKLMQCNILGSSLKKMTLNYNSVSFRSISMPRFNIDDFEPLFRRLENLTHLTLRDFCTRDLRFLAPFHKLKYLHFKECQIFGKMEEKMCLSSVKTLMIDGNEICVTNQRCILNIVHALQPRHLTIAIPYNFHIVPPVNENFLAELLTSGVLRKVENLNFRCDYYIKTIENIFQYLPNLFTFAFCNTLMNQNQYLSHRKNLKRVVLIWTDEKSRPFLNS